MPWAVIVAPCSFSAATIPNASHAQLPHHVRPLRVDARAVVVCGERVGHDDRAGVVEHDDVLLGQRAGVTVLAGGARGGEVLEDRASLPEVALVHGAHSPVEVKDCTPPAGRKPHGR